MARDRPLAGVITGDRGRRWRNPLEAGLQAASGLPTTSDVEVEEAEPAGEPGGVDAQAASG